MPSPRAVAAFCRQEYGYLVIHLLPLIALWTGATGFDWTVCLALYLGRIVFVTGAYHRYFAHRSYRTSRPFQWVLAFLAQTTLQKGALWWAATHRAHHRYSDTDRDPHSPVAHGFWRGHQGWVFDPRFKATRYDLVRDLAKYPELVWLNRLHVLPALLLAASVFLLGGLVNGGSVWEAPARGLSTLCIGFCLSTVLTWQGSYAVNSFSHLLGWRRYDTGDNSRNNPVLAVLVLGDGWHHNHHWYQTSARHGFFWWEIDLTYYFLLILARLGLIWDLRAVPEHLKCTRRSARPEVGVRPAGPA